MRDAHGGEYHHEAGLFTQQLGLAHDLGRQPVMRQSRTGKDGQLLSPDQGIEPSMAEMPVWMNSLG